MRDEKHLSALDRWFGSLAVWMFDHRIVVALVTCLTLAGAAVFAAKPRPDNSFDAFFNASDPIYTAYLNYDDEFGSDEVLYILYSAPDAENGVFDLEVMRTVARLTATIERELPFVEEVTSLTNVEFMTAEDDLLEIHELGLDMPADQAAMNVRREAMMAKPIYRGSLVNDQATHGALLVEMAVTSSDPLAQLRFDPDGGDYIQNLYPQVPAHRIREILARQEYQALEFNLTGDVMMNTAYNEVVNAESGVLALATMAVAGLISLVYFRFQPISLFGPLGVIIVSLLLTVAFMGAVGYDLGMLFLIAPNVLIAISVAQSVHLITEFRLERARGQSRREAVRTAFEHAAVPCLLAALTTAIGIVVMAGSALRSLSEMAVYLGAGVMLAFVGSVTLMVCLMSFGREQVSASVAKSTDESSGLGALLRRVVAINHHHPRTVLAVFSLVLLVSVAGLTQLRIAFNFLDDFKVSVPFREETDRIRQIMTGMINVAVVYDTGTTDGIKSARLLRHLDALQSLANDEPVVGKTYSVVDVLKDLNQSLHGDDPAFHVLPESDELIAQYLLLYELSGGRELADFISTDFARTTLDIRVDFSASDVLGEMLDRLQAQVDADPLAGVEIRFTGIGLLWTSMGRYISDSQIQGYSLAFVMIAVVLALAFRSVKTACLAMIPNLFPIVLVLGAMGLAGMHLNYLRLLLATVAIGIAVDDTVHVVARFKKEFNRCGNYAQAMQLTLMSVGRALVVTSVILASAFLVLHVSEMAVLASFGTLLSLTMIAALLADLFLLPVLICTFKPFGPERQAAQA